MHGTRNNRILHLVAINQRQRRNARPLELLGVYDPHMTPQQEHKTVQWSVDRIRYWLSVGAVPSKSAVKLLELGNILLPGSPYHSQKPVTSATPTSEPQQSSPAS